MAFFPNDPLFRDQWYLWNRGQSLSTGQPGGRPGEDINVLPAWQRGITGRGVLIGVIDDGLEVWHPDLAPNYTPIHSYDFNGEDSNPQAEADADRHGTSVAGIAAGRGGNGIGIVGVAPYATFAALRLTAGAASDEQIARALNHRFQAIAIYSSSWGPADGGGLHGPGPQTQAALWRGTIWGRRGLGTIYVWAAGNGRVWGDNANYDGYANSRYVIAVAALNHRGQFSPYSEPGANILVSAYGDDSITGVTTTDRLGRAGYNPASFSNGARNYQNLNYQNLNYQNLNYQNLNYQNLNYQNLNYTNDFGGTSSATPMVSGTVALMLEANPRLTWRDVQHILVRTARQNDPTHADWQRNGAGHAINHNYGFGVVNAGLAVSRAHHWRRVAREVTFRSPLLPQNRSIPDRGVPLRSVFTLEDNIRVERVEVLFHAAHRQNGDLQVELISPDRTVSTLAESHSIPDRNYTNWVFTSVRHWDELAAGQWTLRVRDGIAQNVGVWNTWQIRVYGTRSWYASDRPDQLRGSDRADAIAGKGGNDILSGLGNRDRLLGGQGDDTLYGGSGSDQLCGGAHRDLLLGGPGNDALYGEGGTDWLRGGPENDLLVGGAETDFLLGGVGNDTFRLEATSGIDHILDFADGRDRLNLIRSIPVAALSFIPQGRNTLIRTENQALALLVGVQPGQLSQADFV